MNYPKDTTTPSHNLNSIIYGAILYEESVRDMILCESYEEFVNSYAYEGETESQYETLVRETRDYAQMRNDFLKAILAHEGTDEYIALEKQLLALANKKPIRTK